MKANGSTNEYAIIAMRMATEIRKIYDAKDEENYGIMRWHEGRLSGIKSVLNIMGIKYHNEWSGSENNNKIVIVEVEDFEAEV